MRACPLSAGISSYNMIKTSRAEGYPDSGQHGPPIEGEPMVRRAHECPFSSLRYATRERGLRIQDPWVLSKESTVEAISRKGNWQDGGGDRDDPGPRQTPDPGRRITKQ